MQRFIQFLLQFRYNSDCNLKSGVLYMKNFSGLHLQPTTLAWIKAIGFKTPTPIQEAVIAEILQGNDVVGISRTGSGKTHAYLIPVMDKVDPADDHIQAVITAATRELAMQIYEQAKSMLQFKKNLRIGLYAGGTDRNKEIRRLRRIQPHIVIGTPGKIRDLFLDEGILRLEQAQMLIIDEADMTLEYGFLDTIDAFAGRMKDSLQMICFSATIPDQLKPFLKRYMHQPKVIRIEDSGDEKAQIKHILIPCYHHSYAQTILRILPGFQPYVCLIFANSRQEASELAKELRKEHLAVTELHGDLSSRQRRQAMKQLAAAQNTYVVATDLAARGIDVAEVTHVISCGFPKDLKYYIHRAGRTGRMHADGVCYALYRDHDDAAIRSLMKQGIHFEHMRFHGGAWQVLRPFGQKYPEKDAEMKKEISRLLTKKKTKVKPGYKKKRQNAIAEMERRKRRDFIRGKIKEERLALYKQRRKELKGER